MATGSVFLSAKEGVMSPQTAKKLVSANINLAEIRHFDPEIQQILSSNSTPVGLKDYLYRRYGNNGGIDIIINGETAELRWILPRVLPQAETLHKDALAYARQRDFKPAITKWTQAVALNPHDPDYYFNLGIAFFESKNYKEAVENLQKTIALCPIYYRAHLILGTVLLKIRKFAEAERHLKESVFFNPRNALAHLNLGAVYSILKKYQEGIFSFQRAIELSPQEIRAYFGMAKIYSIIGDTENANQYYRKVIELDSKGVLANHAKRGIVAVKEPVPSGVISGSSADLETLYSRGYNAFLFSDYQLAVDMYQQYVQRKPEDDYVWSALGAALLRAGQPQQAANAFERAVKINTSKALYYKQLALAYDALNRSQEVIRVLEKAKALGKNDSVTLGLWGKSLIKLNQITEALTPLEQAVKLSKSNLMAQYYLAVVLVRLNRLDNALMHLENVLAARVNTPLKEEAQKLMAKLRA
jgi:tetratricopeptide (TPR) repeat protein